MSTMNTVVLTTAAGVAPASARMAFMLARACAVASTPPSTSAPVAGSMPICPDT